MHAPAKAAGLVWRLSYTDEDDDDVNDEDDDDVNDDDDDNDDDDVPVARAHHVWFLQNLD